MEFGWERGVGEILVADGASEAEHGAGSDGGEAAVRGCGEGAAVDHGVADFDAGGVAVDEDASDFVLEDGDEFSGVAKVVFGTVECGGEMAV